MSNFYGQLVNVIFKVRAAFRRKQEQRSLTKLNSSAFTGSTSTGTKSPRPAHRQVDFLVCLDRI